MSSIPATDSDLAEEWGAIIESLTGPRYRGHDPTEHDRRALLIARVALRIAGRDDLAAMVADELNAMG